MGAPPMDTDLYLQTGPEPLADLDLLALALAPHAGRGARTIASDLLDRHGTLKELMRGRPDQLGEVPGLGVARAARLHAALHLGARAARERPPLVAPVRDAEDAALWLRPLVLGRDQETLAALFLNPRSRPIRARVLTTGTDRATICDPRQILRTALEAGASAVVLAHNHPSGDCEASPEDIQSTRIVARACSTVGIALVDHLILTDHEVTSMRLQGLIPGA